MLSSATWEAYRRPDRRFCFESSASRGSAQSEWPEQLLRRQDRLVAGYTMAAGAARRLDNPLGVILAAANYANQFKMNPAFSELAGDSRDAIEEEAKRSGRILRSQLASIGSTRPS